MPVAESTADWTSVTRLSGRRMIWGDSKPKPEMVILNKQLDGFTVHVGECIGIDVGEYIGVIWDGKQLKRLSFFMFVSQIFQNAKAVQINRILKGSYIWPGRSQSTSPKTIRISAKFVDFLSNYDSSWNVWWVIARTKMLTHMTYTYRCRRWQYPKANTGLG